MTSIKIFFRTKTLKMLCLGFSSGLPILLVFSTLSVWLVKAGISRSTVTLFSWAGFAYAFKYLWAPLVDNYRLPLLQKLGHRRSWLILTQLLIVSALIGALPPCCIIIPFTPVHSAVLMIAPKFLTSDI